MSSKQMKKQRWVRLNKIKKRRCNFFALEKAVQKLANDSNAFRDLIITDSEQLHDLVSKLELRVKALQSELCLLRGKYKALELKQQPVKISFWRGLFKILGSKGEP